MPTVTGLASSFITFSRPGASGGGATVTDRDGKIKWAGHNLLLASESFDSSSWSKTASTVAANTTVAPNGLTTADTFKEDNTTIQHQITQSLTVPIGIVTFRVYAKLGSGTRYLQMRPSGLGTGVAYVNFDLSSGVVVPSGSGGTALVSASVTPSTNGFYLCEMVANFASAPSGMMFQLSNGTTENTSYAGDNTSSIILWGAHLYRSDLGGMQANPAMGAGMGSYYPTTPRNFLGYTEDLGFASVWGPTRSTVATTAITAPNGLSNARTITASSGTSGTHYVRQVLTLANSLHVLSVYAKAGTRPWLFLSNTSVANASAYFNLSNGTAGTVGAAATASVTSIGDGWYRCSILFTAAAGSNEFRIAVATADATASFTSDGTETIYLWGAQLSDSASLDTYVPSYGAAVTSAAYYAPRLDFDPVTLAARGLLVEEQRTNVVPNSNVFNIAAWPKGAGGTAVAPVVTAADAVAPDGTLTAQKVVFDRGSGNTITDNSVLSTTISGYAAATSYTGSVYIKAATAGDVGKQLGWRHVAGGSYGVITLTADWQRVTRTETSSGTSSTIEFVSRGTVTTDNSVGAHIWGVSVEVGASNAATTFATSLIVTGASTATRTADVASVSTQAFPYSATEGTVVVNATALTVLGSTRRFVTLDDGTLNNRINLYLSSAGRNKVYVVSGGTPQADIDSLRNITPGVPQKSGFAFANNDFSYVVDGDSPATDPSGTVPIASTLRIGAESSGSYLNGHIRQITYLPRRLTNAELQARTL